VCLAHVPQIKSNLGITGIISNVCSWRSTDSKNEKGAQIDLVIERDDNVIDICEVKYTKEKYTVDSTYNEVIQNKKARFIQELQTSKAVHLVLISASEVQKNEFSDEFQKIILADSLFC
jgi:hypothetical protein